LTHRAIVQRIDRLIRSSLEDTGLAHRNVLLVVASSGGPDSQALLYSLLAQRDDLDVRLHVAHLNHNFREEADEDARFVAAQARELSLPSTVEKADPIAYQKEQGISSFEAAAREVRYDFLARVAEDTGAAAVALGHTADDQAETVIMHILRGTGLHGLRGMEPISPWRHPRKDVQTTLVRPLLEVAKADTEAYCKGRSIPYRIDPHNASLRFTRNRVRHKLMPTLRSYNPRIRESLLRLARTSAQQVSYLEQEVDRAWSRVARDVGLPVVLDSAATASLHPFLQSLILRRAYEEAAGMAYALEESHIQAMMGMLQGAPGKTLHLPRGVKLVTGYGEVILGKGAEVSCPLPPLEGEHTLNIPGETHIPGWLVRADILDRSPSELPDGRSAACFDMEALGGKLWVRGRRRGDRIQPLGMETSRKLHDLLVDEKVPRHWRDSVPLVLSERGIAWAVGYRTSHWARVKTETRRVLRLEFQREEPHKPL
jgi:tRNA(Ile)-lysidine synthase